MMKLLFFSIFLTAHFVNAQSINGIVVDIDNAPISMAVVQVVGENNHVISYSTTGDDGIFSFENIQKGKYTIVVNHWSFQKKTLPISVENLNHHLTITLEETPLELEQVEVQARNLLAHKKGDTLAYNLKAISDGSERKLKDLLNKLPGIQVDPITGKITANGKVVDDLLINGQKLFGNNHKLATENIKAQMLEEISLIHNYEKFSVLKDISDSDKTAINLTIKEEFMGDISGEIELLGGHRERYKVHPKIFQFDQKHSFSIIANANNTAEESMSFLDFVELNSSIKSDIRNQNLSQTISDIPFPAFLLSDKKAHQKQNEFASMYWVFQPQKNWHINSYLIGNHAKLSENFLSKKNFYTHNLSIEDTQKSKTHHYNLMAKINSDYYFKENTLLNYTFSFSKNQSDRENHLENTYTHDSYQEIHKPNYTSVGGQLSLIQKLNKISLISFNTYHEYKSNDNTLDIKSNTLLLGTPHTSFYQKMNTHSHDWGGFVKYTLKINKNILNASTGYSALHQRTDYKKNSLTDILNRKYLYSNISAVRKKSAFEYATMAEIRYFWHENATFFVPQIIGKYHFKKDLHWIEGKYKREVMLPSVLQINPIGYANDWRNYYSSSELDKNTPTLQNVYEIYYLFVNLYHGINLFALSRYAQNENVISHNYRFENNTHYISHRLAKGGFQWINKMNLGIHLFRLKQKINLTGSYHFLENPFFRNAILDKNWIKETNISLTLSSVFKQQPYNYLAGISFYKIKNETTHNQLTQYIPRVDMVVHFSKNIKGYFNHSYHISSSDGLQHNFWDLNYKIYYEKSKWKWYITGENFLHLNGNKILHFNKQNTYVESQQIEQLAGFVGLGLVLEI